MLQILAVCVTNFIIVVKVCLRRGSSKFSRLCNLRASVVVIRALLKLKIHAKNAVFDPVHSRKIGLRFAMNELKRSIVKDFRHLRGEGVPEAAFSSYKGEGSPAKANLL